MTWCRIHLSSLRAYWALLPMLALLFVAPTWAAERTVLAEHFANTG